MPTTKLSCSYCIAEILRNRQLYRSRRWAGQRVLHHPVRNCDHKEAGRTAAGADCGESKARWLLRGAGTAQCGCATGQCLCGCTGHRGPNAGQRVSSEQDTLSHIRYLLLSFIFRAFISYLGTIKQLREKPSSQRNDTSGRSSTKSLEFDNEYSQVAISELKKIATLGCGAFGRVDLVAYNQQALALKIIKKIEVVKQDQIEHVYNEKNVMIKCRQSPFIVQCVVTQALDSHRDINKVILLYFISDYIARTAMTNTFTS